MRRGTRRETYEGEVTCEGGNLRGNTDGGDLELDRAAGNLRKGKVTYWELQGERGTTRET